MNDFFVVGVGRFAVIGLQLAYVKVYTNILNSAQLGYYAFWFTVAYLFSAIVFVPVDYYLQSKLYEWRREGISVTGALLLNVALVKWSLLVTLLIGCIVGIVSSPIMALGTVVSLVYGVVNQFCVSLRNLTNNLEHKKTATSFLVIDGVLKLTILFVAKQYFNVDSVLLITFALFSGVISLVTYLLVMKRLGIFFGGKVVEIKLSEISKFCMPISLSSCANWMQLQGYRLVLIPLGFSEVVGVYSAVAGVGAAAMNAAGSIYSQLFTPSLYKYGGKTLNKYIGGAILLSVFSCLITLLFGKQVVNFLTNETLAQHYNLMLFGILIESGNLIIGAMVVFSTIISSNQKVLIASILGVLACFAMLAVAYLHLTIWTVGMPMVISQFLVGVYLYIKSCRRHH
ncbi:MULTISPECIES: polysaccharide biosynthesis protein [Chromobacterium]|uniref:hypothetical protein n=1 Tax=Chromobacterium TaxID=535 RepID=UPI00188928C3|nr:MULTISPECIES: hypothetical protein [Chromobacterium]WON82823.1 hypothetical protein OK026_16940 [Chromobacterium haemolyticum]